jgi:hypothetical protein
VSPPRKRLPKATTSRPTTRKPAAKRPPKQSSDEREERFIVPERDGAAVGRVASCVEIKAVELVGAEFSRADAGPQSAVGDPPTPEMGIGPPDWRLDRGSGTLASVFTFLAHFPEREEAPYQLVASFRLLYEFDPTAEFSDEDAEQFVYWNVVFNAWPYWREYLSSTINRAGFPRFVAPVMGVPL